MPEAAEEELAGVLAVGSAVETEGQVADVQVDGQRHQWERPGGETRQGRHRGEADQSQAVAKRHASAQVWVCDGHHAVATARVVFTQVPAQRVEVGELPAVQEAAHQQSPCRERETDGIMIFYSSCGNFHGLITTSTMTWIQNRVFLEKLVISTLISKLTFNTPPITLTQTLTKIKLKRTIQTMKDTQETSSNWWIQSKQWEVWR